MISGLVVYLNADAELADAALIKMRQQASLELGEPSGQRLPMVLETATAADSHSVADWLIGLPGVDHLDVVFVDLDEQPTPTAEPEPEQRAALQPKRC